MNNQVQFICLWCCVPPDFVVQINNFFILVLFSSVINKKSRKKLIRKTITYKLGISSKTQFASFYPKDIQNCFWKTIDFFQNHEMTQITGGGGHVICVIMMHCVRISISDSLLRILL